MTNPNNSSFNSYLPTSIFLPDEPKQMLIRLQGYLREISLKVNIRQLGFYEDIETPAGQAFFSVDDTSQKRLSFRKVFQFGPIVAGTTLNIIHGLGTVSLFTNIYGTILTAVPDNRPLPYVDEAVVTNQVSVKIVGANIVIINGATAPNITSGIVILEYLKN